MTDAATRGRDSTTPSLSRHISRSRPTGEWRVCRSLLPVSAHALCSWAKFSPGINSSAGKNKGNGSTGHGDRYLARVLGEAAPIAGRTDTFLGERYRRIARRRGKKKAIVAVGRSMLVIIWHLLADPETRYHDLGADHFAPTRQHRDQETPTTSDSSRPSIIKSPSNPAA